MWTVLCARVLQAPELFVAEYCRCPSTFEGVFEFSRTPSRRCLQVLPSVRRGCEALMPQVVVQSTLYGVTPAFLSYLNYVINHSLKNLLNLFRRLSS
jgi:hypothetical protein